MSGFYKKAVVWLGLNEEYPDHEGMQGSPQDARAEMPEGSERGEGVRAVAPAGDGGAPGAAASPGPAPGPNPTPSPERAPRQRPAQREATANPLTANASYDRSEGTVRAIPMDDAGSSTRGSATGPSSGSSGASSSSGSSSATGTVRAVPMPKTTKPQVVVPQSFNNAQDVADMFRDNQPVIVNMQQAERDLARRLIDFSSGLCYGLGGQMEKVAKDVYLLTPTDVEVSAADREDF